jgi:hypothetical protein
MTPFNVKGRAGRSTGVLSVFRVISCIAIRMHVSFDESEAFAETVCKIG